jgi:hypothetical protein
VEEPLITLGEATTGLRCGFHDAWELPLDQIDGTAVRDTWVRMA